MKRLSLILSLMLQACASISPLPPDLRVAGCWISPRMPDNTTTMRWFQDLDHPGALRGEALTYGIAGPMHPRRYGLEPRSEGWALCDRDASTCWDVAQGQSGPLDGGRAFIDAHRDHLRIAIIRPESEDVIFEGERDGCD